MTKSNIKIFSLFAAVIMLLVCCSPMLVYADDLDSFEYSYKISDELLEHMRTETEPIHVIIAIDPPFPKERNYLDTKKRVAELFNIPEERVLRGYSEEEIEYYKKESLEIPQGDIFVSHGMISGDFSKDEILKFAENEYVTRITYEEPSFWETDLDIIEGDPEPETADDIDSFEYSYKLDNILRDLMKTETGDIAVSIYYDNHDNTDPDNYKEYVTELLDLPQNANMIINSEQVWGWFSKDDIMRFAQNEIVTSIISNSSSDPDWPDTEVDNSAFQEMDADLALHILRASTGLETIDVSANDFDKDGILTANDAVIVLRRSVGLE